MAGTAVTVPASQLWAAGQHQWARWAGPALAWARPRSHNVLTDQQHNKHLTLAFPKPSHGPALNLFPVALSNQVSPAAAATDLFGEDFRTKTDGHCR